MIQGDPILNFKLKINNMTKILFFTKQFQGTNLVVFWTKLKGVRKVSNDLSSRFLPEDQFSTCLTEKC